MINISTSPIFKISVLSAGVRNLLKKFEFDKAVLFGFLGQIWMSGAGIVTSVLIATCFTPELQGYYYTFGSILQFQILVELGLGTVIVQFASHEWSKLMLDKNCRIVGDEDSRSRLISLAGLVLRWYSVSAVIILCVLSFGGYIFFKSSSSSHINWVFPWLFLSFFTGTQLILVPAWSLLEGCNQVANLYKFRFFQGMINSLTVCVAIYCGARLWTAAISSLVIIICAFIFLKRKYWPFMKILFFSKSSGPGINWRSEILPMQWRIAVSWICGYIIFSLFVPVLFKYHGPVLAGQMGMSWSLLNLIGLAESYVYPRRPQFGILVAEKKYSELDSLFWRIVKMFTVIVFSIAIMICVLVWILNFFNLSISNRILPLKYFMLFAIPKVLVTLTLPFSLYMFAHKRNPLMVLTVINAVLTICSTLVLGKIYSAAGIGYGFLAVQLFIVPFIFIIWYRSRAAWHGGNLSDKLLAK